MPLTHEVAEFIVETPATAIPDTVQRLGKRSILDGLGLALAGQRAETGRLVREYLATLGLGGGPSTVLGTELRTAPRFAAFANAIGVHAECYWPTHLDCGEWRLETAGLRAGCASISGPNGIPALHNSDCRIRLRTYNRASKQGAAMAWDEQR